MESDDGFVNNDDQSDIISINSNVNNKEDSRFLMNNDNMIFVSQNEQGLRSNLRRINLDAIVQNMICRNLSVYCIQETWLDRNFIKEIEGYTKTSMQKKSEWSSDNSISGVYNIL